MKKAKKPIFFRFLRRLCIWFTPKYEIIIKTPLDNTEGNIFVSNHAQALGPIAMQLYFPKNKKIWTIGEMFNKKEVSSYVMKDFWPNKPKSTRWFYKLLSHILAPLSAFIFKHADTLPVYKDQRFFTTIKKSVAALKENEDIIIFPEYHQPKNQIVNNFLENYVSVASIYYKSTKKNVKFYPLYISPRLRKIIIGEPTIFDSNQTFDEEKTRINNYLMDNITKMAQELPVHIVIPYDNIKKKNYPKSR